MVSIIILLFLKYKKMNSRNERLIYYVLRIINTPYFYKNRIESSINNHTVSMCYFFIFII
ncbi:hypothetical protein BJ944DRAFT_264207 [Cunninghamella echinulata]|nr:hypothetical protein BJ944DRAFT_264207 [Cunninghamella echinulata]